MRLSVSTFWPQANVLPTRRLIQAALLAPLIVSVVIVLLAFLIAGMSESNSAGVVAVTLNAASILVPVLFLFMFTFGALGIVALWLLRLRNAMAWAVCGALMGALASWLTGELQTEQVTRPLLIGSAVVGWSMLLLFRWLAGIRQSVDTDLDDG